MNPWYKSPTTWLGITSIVIAALDGIMQSGIVTDNLHQQLLLAAIGILTVWRRAAVAKAVVEDPGQTPTVAAPATTTPEVPRG